MKHNIAAIVTALIIAGAASMNGSAFAQTGALGVSDAALAQQIAEDKRQIGAGQAPPDIIKYDVDIANMTREGQSIVASHDKQRARIWEDKYHALVAARNKSVHDFLAPRIKMNEAMANVLESGRANRCLNAMGRDICHAQPAPSQETYPCPTGPGADEAQVGEGQGGEPMCRRVR